MEMEIKKLQVINYPLDKITTFNVYLISCVKGLSGDTAL